MVTSDWQLLLIIAHGTYMRGVHLKAKLKYTEKAGVVASQLLATSSSIREIIISYYRAATCDIICLEAVVLPGDKTMERLYGNERKFSSFSLTSPALVIEHLQL